MSDVAPGARSRFRYVYDVGDSWSHEVRVEKVLARESEVSYPVYPDGELACPLDDCGAVWRYADILTALQAPDDPKGRSRCSLSHRSLVPAAVVVAGFKRSHWPPTQTLHGVLIASWLGITNRTPLICTEDY